MIVVHIHVALQNVIQNKSSGVSVQGNTIVLNLLRKTEVKIANGQKLKRWK